MAITLYQLIVERKQVEPAAIRSLIEILGYRARRQTKEQLRHAIFNRFYTCFEGKNFTKQFEFVGIGFKFNPTSKNRETEELKAIRDYVILTGGTKNV